MKIKNFMLVLSIFVLSWVNVSCTDQTKRENKTNIQVKETVSKSENTARLKSSYVCYVNDRFMGIDQIPVEVDSKIYFGCCEGCVDKLQKNLEGVRYGIDPLTGNKVDKATAYIVLKPNANGAVLYFESEVSYSKFKKNNL